MSTPACIALTGLDTFWGSALAERLLERPAGPRVVGIDLERPLRLAGHMDFHQLDLSEPYADLQVAEIIQKTGADVFVHLAHGRTPTRCAKYSAEAEAAATRCVLNATEATGLSRLVIPSSTMLYGARSDNPNFLTESHPLRGHAGAHWVQNRIECEALIRNWSERHPLTEVSVLRSCWSMGPEQDDDVARFFARSVVPTSLGHDPLFQFIHEQDLLDVFEQAACESHPGVFNIVGRGVLPLSTLLALAGRRRLPLPRPVLEWFPGPPPWQQEAASPAAFFDYLRYLWVADGERGWAEFGEPQYSSREAWISFTSTRRVPGAG